MASSSAMCFAAAALAASPTVFAQVAAPAPAAYDCNVGVDNWEQLWTPDWQAWCCQHERKGCPSTSTHTATTTGTSTSTGTSTLTTTLTLTLTSTSTSTTRTGTSTTTTTNPCDSQCEVKGFSATCGARIRWAASHETKDEISPCVAAVGLVSTDCGEVCSSCSLVLAGCEALVDREEVLRKFELPDVDLGHSTFWTPAAGALAVIGLSALLLLGSAAVRFQRGSRAVYTRTSHTVDEEFLVDDA